MDFPECMGAQQGAGLLDAGGRLPMDFPERTGAQPTAQERARAD
jgi:hypothetical protein